MSQEHRPVASIGATFATGATSAFLVVAGVFWLRPDIAVFAFDWSGNGLDLGDALAPAWMLGHVALIVHPILPGITRA